MIGEGLPPGCAHCPGTEPSGAERYLPQTASRLGTVDHDDWDRMAVPSSFPGMGARLLPGGGTSFRVWAPFAERVQVAGSFSDWARGAVDLALEGGGYWSVDVPDAKYMDEYKYVLRHQGQTLWRNDPYAREVTRSDGNSMVIDPSFDWEADTDFRMPAWNELVVYEMHLGTFNDTPGGPAGSFATAIARLPYLSHELGVNAINLMPTYEFPGDFSWGYNPAHLFAIESSVGGPKALRRFIDAAHANGIAVIMDVVYNHLGPADLDLWQFDGWKLHDDRGGIYFYNDERAGTPWGHTRPDYGRPEVRQFLRDNALFWLEEFRADGLRWDSTVTIRRSDVGDLVDGWSLMQWVNDEINSRQPWKISIAEDLQDDAGLIADIASGGAGFASQWDAGFVHPVRQVLITPQDTDRNMYAVAGAIEHGYGTDALQRVIYTESHDEVANGKRRLPEEIWPGWADSWFAKKRSSLGAGLVMTAPGIPMIFQGQEFLEDQWFHDEDPLDWARRDRFAGLVLLYRDLIRLRRNWYDTTRGLRGQHLHVHHVNDADKLVAFHRWEHGGPRDDVVVVANFADRAYPSYEIGFPRPGWWRVRLNSDWSGYDPEFGDVLSYDTVAGGDGRDGMPHGASVGIGPYSLVILSQDD